ncbi:hypothetical protein Q7P35_008598 [Cladosporium inversicolor]
MALDKDAATVESKTLPQPRSEEISPQSSLAEKKPLKRRNREILWDSIDRTPEERWFIHKIDFFILTWASLSYFSKNLNTNNASNAYVSGMKEDLNIVGNEYQMLTTMWTIGYVISQIPSQLIFLLSLWCPSWELFWVIVTFTTASVKTTHQLMATELAKRACIFFASAFIGSMFSGYLRAAVCEGLDGHGLREWRWLFLMDGIITLPMALWGYYSLPDLLSNTRVRWLTPAEKALAVDRMQKIGRALEEPFTLAGLRRVLGKWHVWVYTAYYTFFICSENIGGFMNLWLKSLGRYTVVEINIYPTAMPAITIVTTLIYGWTSDALQLRAPIVYFSLAVCFFAAVNLAVRDGVPFHLKWASYYLTSFAQGSGPMFLTMVNEETSGDSLERKLILGSTNAIAYAFNAWIALITYDTTSDFDTGFGAAASGHEEGQVCSFAEPSIWVRGIFME